jgi:hypothetical protein
MIAATPFRAGSFVELVPYCPGHDLLPERVVLMQSRGAVEAPIHAGFGIPKQNHDFRVCLNVLKMLAPGSFQ